MTNTHQLLTPDERAQLAVAEHEFAKDGQATSFDSLWQQWNALIQEIERGYKLTIYDYTNDLTARDRIDRLLQVMPQTLRDRLGAAVASSDARFERSTEARPKPLLSRPGPWWRRVPKHRGTEFEDDLKT